MAEFKFTNELSNTMSADVVDLLRKPRLWIPTDKDYPNHNNWLDKTESQIIDGTKRAMVAYMGSSVVGAVIYQRDPNLSTNLEIRNISVAPDARGRYIGAFLLRNSELEASHHDFPEIDQITIDTKTTNMEMVSFLLAQGYSSDEITDLYGLGAGLDVVLRKSI